MNAEIKIFPSTEALAEAVARELEKESKRASENGRPFNLVLSGGSTPRSVYEVFARAEFKNSIPWEAVHFFWGDERAVLPDHADSNYRMTRQAMLDPLAIPESNIHRIKGESEPEVEAARYGQEIKRHCHLAAGKLPAFDWILLGLGSDGHTASLFPGANEVEDPSGICGVAVHPESGQKRVTLTLNVLNHARRVSFIVTGQGKARIVAEILKLSPESQHYPAAHVRPENGTLDWFLDQEAVSMFKK